MLLKFNDLLIGLFLVNFLYELYTGGASLINDLSVNYVN